MYPNLTPIVNDLRLRDVHAAAARDRLVPRARPGRPGGGSTLGRWMTVALAAVAFVLGKS